ncbi:hypothetical protein ACODM8_15210 [Vibrio ostreicida]|uniref:hypothetical protein n=1 Tax=Vibrio ostreicida TaxID=526588 RepID=UPI003B5C7C54
MNGGVWLLAFTISCTSFVTRACTYDGQFRNPFAESYPSSIDVAISTFDALNTGRIQDVKPLKGQQGLTRASWWLKLFINKYENELKSVTYIYLIDSHLWSKVSRDNRLDIHIPTPFMEKEPVLLLSEAALNALVNGNVDLNGAKILGIARF